MAVAIAALSDSPVGRSGGNDGMVRREVTVDATGCDMPLPSLPMMMMPQSERGAVSISSPLRNVP